MNGGTKMIDVNATHNIKITLVKDPALQPIVKTRVAEWWPTILPDTTRQDGKVLRWLSQEAAENPEDSEKQLALRNAQNLQRLISRANALKWPIFMCRDSFAYLAWNGGGMVPYQDSEAAATIAKLESKIAAAEKLTTHPDICDQVLSTLLDLFLGFLEIWKDEVVWY